MSASNYELSKLKIKDIDIDPGAVVEINIYESITSPGITGNIQIKDWQALKEQFEVFPGDSFEIQWKTTEGKDHLFVAKIYSPGAEKVSVTQEYKFVEFKFCSPWLFELYSRQFSRPYRNKKVEYIVRDILTECGAPIESIVSFKQTVDRYVLPLWTPSHHLKTLMSWGLSEVGEQSGFVYFSNLRTDSVIMTTVHNLYEGQLGKIKNPIVLQSANAYYEGNAADIFIEGTYDQIKLANQGFGKSKFISFDSDVNKAFSSTETVLDYDHAHLGSKAPFLTEYVDDKYQTTGFVFQYHQGAKQDLNSEGANDIVRALSRKRYSYIFADIFRLTCMVPGAVDRRCGALIDVHMPNSATRENETQRDQQMDGTYLIRDIRHSFAKGDYAQFLGLCSDGYKLTERLDLVRWKK